MSKVCKKCNGKDDSRCEKMKEIKEKRYLKNMPFKQIDKEELSSLESKTSLFIIGNGFDLMHDVPSSYYDFRDSLGKNNRVKVFLESFIHIEDVWGDFENSLAYLDRESMLGVLDMWFENFEVLDEYDDNFSAADYFAAQEVATMPTYVLTTELPKAFRKWIESLKYNGKVKPLIRLIKKDARYINFNYTEFLETIYNVNKDNILYIHGDRREKECELVLGHGHSTDKVFEEWYESNKNKKEYQAKMSKGKIKYDTNDNPVYLGYFLKDERLGNWKSQIRYDGINNVVRTIENYYDESSKKTRKVLESNKNYFKSLNNLKDIVVIGHSLSSVDDIYFKKIIDINKDNNKLNWYFSWYNLCDLKRISKFIIKMNLDYKNISIFKV